MKILDRLKAYLFPEPPRKLICRFKWGPLDGCPGVVELAELAAGCCWRTSQAGRLLRYEFIRTEEPICAAFWGYEPAEVPNVGR